MPLTDFTFNGLPVIGEVRLPWVVIQRSRTRPVWGIMLQRYTFEHALNAIIALDVTRPTHICRVTTDGKLSAVRSWN